MNIGYVAAAPPSPPQGGVGLHPYGMQDAWERCAFYRAMHPYGMRPPSRKDGSSVENGQMSRKNKMKLYGTILLSRRDKILVERQMPSTPHRPVGTECDTATLIFRTYGTNKVGAMGFFYQYFVPTGQQYRTIQFHFVPTGQPPSPPSGGVRGASRRDASLGRKRNLLPTSASRRDATQLPPEGGWGAILRGVARNDR